MTPDQVKHNEQVGATRAGLWHGNRGRKWQCKRERMEPAAVSAWTRRAARHANSDLDRDPINHAPSRRQEAAIQIELDVYEQFAMEHCHVSCQAAPARALAASIPEIAPPQCLCCAAPRASPCDACALSWACPAGPHIQHRASPARPQHVLNPPLACRDARHAVTELRHELANLGRQSVRGAMRSQHAWLRRLTHRCPVQGGVCCMWDPHARPPSNPHTASGPPARAPPTPLCPNASERRLAHLPGPPLGHLWP